MRLYNELAEWWPVFSAPEDYEEEAGIYAKALFDNATTPLKHVLEIGSGGGNNASFLKLHFDMTLVDLSEGMLGVSRKLNPECHHIQGDMRTVRLGRSFDAVMIHDAIAYMHTEEDLGAAIASAAAHLDPGGIALFVPDETTENYRAETTSGGHDGEGRAVRFLQWTGPLEGNVADNHFVYVLMKGEQMHIEHEVHRFGVFPRATWLRLMDEAGLEAKTLPYPHSEFEHEHELFLGTKR